MSEPVRVLHVIPTIALEHGGPSHAVRIMASAVADLGAEVDVATTSYGTPQGLQNPKGTSEYIESGVRYRLFPQMARSRWNVSLPLTRWLFENVGRYDVLHVHAPFAYPTLPACIAARHAKVPYIYRTIGALDPWSLRQKSWKKWPYYHLLERRNLHRAYRVHVTSRAEQDAIEALGVPRKRIVLIALGIPGALRQTPFLPAHPLRLLFIGRLHPKKGIPLVIDAVSRLRASGADVLLDIAGSGDDGYTRTLVAQVHRLGLDQVVRFAGFATGDRKLKLFEQAHVVVLPAYDENFGISVAEAMARGLAVVISEAVGIADLVRGARAGRVCPTGDSVALAAALHDFMLPSEREACGDRGIALVAAEFSVPVMARRLMSEYVRASRKVSEATG